MTSREFQAFGREIDRRIAADPVAAAEKINRCIAADAAAAAARDATETVAVLDEIDRCVIDDAARDAAEDAAEVAPSITTHNGIFTVQSAATGEHRTFRVKTQKADAEFAPGERIVSLLVGQDNTNDYSSFGILKADGRIIVWKKHRDTQVEKLARMLEHLDVHVAKGHVTVYAETRCRCCNRRLTDPISASLGIGPKCGGRE